MGDAILNDITDDSEIVEVFVEEAGEVFENIDNHLPIWNRQLNDIHALTEIRRGFHTLKGSGRMVNALDLSEVAWRVENMLNRVIDGTLPVAEPMVELVSTARNLMPEMLEAFEKDSPMDSQSEVETLIAQADALAAGRKTPVPAPEKPVVAAATNEGLQSLAEQIGRLDRDLRRFQQRSDEALHRSEMALRQARGVTAQLQVVRRETQDSVYRAEINPVIERVNLLSKEILDLQREIREPLAQLSIPTQELNELVGTHVHERMALIERRRNAQEKQLNDARVAAATSRRLASWSLALSVLIGGAAISMLLMS